MTSLNSRLQLALLNRKKGRNALEKGFTLVELMIVIVIVGILSAIALPNFLSQTEKAKATEAKSKMSAFLKQGHAEWQELGETTDAEGLANNDVQGRFTYDCAQINVAGGSTTIVEDSLVCMAQANDTDNSIVDKIAYGCVNLETGYTQLSKGLIDGTTGTSATNLGTQDPLTDLSTNFYTPQTYNGAEVDVDCGSDPSA